MTADANRQLVQAYFDHINQRNEDAYAALHDTSTTAQAPGASDTLSGEEMRAYTRSFIQAFPDLHFALTQCLADEDHVVVHWLATGTHGGPLAGPKGEMVAATGKAVRIYGTSTLAVREGKIQSSRILWDRADLLEQLGLL